MRALAGLAVLAATLLTVPLETGATSLPPGYRPPPVPEYCASRSNRVARRDPRLPCPRGEIRVAQHDLMLCSRGNGPVSVRAFSCNASEILLVSIPADEQPPVCLCTKEVAPVCGEDGRTYENRCLAACAGEAVAHDGPCESILCPAVHDPVCGTDGNTYSNGCHASSRGVAVAYPGTCRNP